VRVRHRHRRTYCAHPDRRRCARHRTDSGAAPARSHRPSRGATRGWLDGHVIVGLGGDACVRAVAGAAG
jgi:hypothetical protein